MSELIFQHHGEIRERNATEGELQIFDIIKEMTGLDLSMVNKSDQYQTILFGESDLVRVKYTPRAKWIMFPAVERGGTKNRINTAEDVRNYQEALEKSLEVIRKFTNEGFFK